MKNMYFFSACFLTFLTTIYAEEIVSTSCLQKEKALALLETAENLLTKARISLPSCKKGDLNTTDESDCGREEKPLAYIEISKKLISDVRKNFPACSKPEEKEDKVVQEDKFRDCSEILASGRNKSGVYKIWSEEPFTTGKSMQVYCDMETDKEGWTVIQRRGKFPVQQDFYQDWETYKNGFGNLTEEFWLGNENIRVLCRRGCKIRFDLQDKNGEKGYALYQSFKLSDSYYTLRINGYVGNVGDCMMGHNYFDFSAKDKGIMERAKLFKGGWWYRPVDHFSNLNGVLKPGVQGFESVFWFNWRKSESLAGVEMKVKSK